MLDQFKETCKNYPKIALMEMRTRALAILSDTAALEKIGKDPNLHNFINAVEERIKIYSEDLSNMTLIFEEIVGHRLE